MNRRVASLAIVILALLGAAGILLHAVPAFPVPGEAGVGESDPLVSGTGASVGSAEADLAAQRRALAAEPRAEVSLPERDALGSVSGQLLDQHGSPVPGVVQLRSEDLDRARTTETDATGQFRFAGLGDGQKLELRVDADSLPVGFLPPWRQDALVHSELSASLPDGFYGTGITMPDGGREVSVILRVFRAATVIGRVLGPGGEPVENAGVRLQSVTPGLEGLSSDARTDSRGLFEMSRVYPGVYRTQVGLGNTAPQFQDLGKPAPTRLEILEGSVQQSLVIRVGLGKRSVSGRVLDQDGAPFSGLSVLAYFKGEVPPGERQHTLSSSLAHGVTDDNGEYELSGLPEGRVGIQIGPHGIAARWEEKELARRVEPIYLDLREELGRVRAPDRVAVASRPFSYTGKIVLDKSVPGAEHLSPGSLRVRVIQAAQLTPSGQPIMTVWGRIEGVGVKVSEEGTFEWKCDAPHEPFVVRVTGGRFPEVRVLVTPFENGEVSEEIRFPW